MSDYRRMWEQWWGVLGFGLLCASAGGVISQLAWQRPGHGLIIGWCLGVLVAFLVLSLAAQPLAGPISCVLVPVGMIPAISLAADQAVALIILLAALAGLIPVLLFGAIAHAPLTARVPLERPGARARRGDIRRRPAADARSLAEDLSDPEIAEWVPAGVG